MIEANSQVADFSSRRTRASTAEAWIAVVLGVLFVGALLQYSYIEGDTRKLFDDSRAFVACLRGGEWGHCPEGGKFSPLQLLLSVPAAALGASSDATCTLLARVSTASFLALLLVAWKTLARRSRAVAWGVLLVLASGELLHYAVHSTAEMLAAFLTLAFIASLLMGKTAWLVAITALLAGISKDTAVPFLGLLGIVCVFARRRHVEEASTFWHTERARALGAGLGLVAAGVCVAALNGFRFGSPWNATYLSEATSGPSPAQWARIVAALWIAPNGGWLFFWPLFVAFLVCVPFALRRHRASRSLLDWLPLAGVGVLLAGLSASFAAWWAPFGWWAWGQRLMLPWLPAVLVLLGYSYAPELERLSRSLFCTPLRAATFAAVVVVLSLPHLATVFKGMQLIWDTFVDNYNHPRSTPGYYPWLERAAWSDPSPLLKAYRLVLHPFVRGRVLLWVPLLALAGRRFSRACR